MSGCDWLLDCVVEFLEVAVHQILCSRGVYAAEVFEKRTKYGVCVSCSRHPQLNAYIRTVLDNCRPLLKRGLLERLLVCVCDASGMPTEYTSIELELFPTNMTEDADTSSFLVFQLEEEFRSVVLKLSLLDSSTRQPLPEDHQFQLLAVTKDMNEATPNAASTTDDAAAVLQQALTSGEWLVDNSLLPEHAPRQDGTVMAVKSVENLLMHMQVLFYALQ